MYNTETRHIQILIDNNQQLLEEAVAFVKEGTITHPHQMEDWVKELFPESYEFAREDKGAYHKDILLFAPSLVLAALDRVDYGYLIRHYYTTGKERDQ